MSWDSHVNKLAAKGWVPQVGFLVAVGNFIFMKSRLAQVQLSLLSVDTSDPFLKV